MPNLREALEALYDAGFYAKYPNELGRIKHRGEAIQAALKGIGMSADEVVIRETLREFQRGCIGLDPAVDSKVTLGQTYLWIESEGFVEALMERL